MAWSPGAHQFALPAGRSPDPILRAVIILPNGLDQILAARRDMPWLRAKNRGFTGANPEPFVGRIARGMLKRELMPIRRDLHFVGS